MLPGMIGTHEHGTMLMAFSSGLTMEMSRDAGIMLGNVREYLAENPGGPYVSFGGAFEGTVDIFPTQRPSSLLPAGPRGDDVQSGVGAG